MTWPKEHKALTRDRIVQAAAAAFRARGVSGVRVDEIMADAGLTHGGFYAHFASKDDLLRAAVQRADGESFETLSKALESAPGGRRVQAVIDAYLSPWHARHTDRGCPVAALAAELTRMRGRSQRHLAKIVRARLDWLRTLETDQAGGGMTEDALIGTLACMVGGLTLARAVEPADAASLLEACRTFLHRTLARDARRRASRSRPSPRPRAARRSGKRRNA